MNIKFLGAAKNVTGSKFLLEVSNKRILIDCGLYQEREFKSRNWDDFPVSPSSIDAIILTHGHLDHCGYLPKIVKDGFKGKIFCTEPTLEIVKIILLDSGKIQEEDAFKKKSRHKKEGRKGPHPEIPLYTIEDAKQVFPLLRGYPYKTVFEVTNEVTASFYDAGHILGAAMIELKVQSNGKTKTIIFSGDIGRWNKPILNDPTLFEKADIVFMESTYGNREHKSEDIEGDKLAKIIRRTAKEGGNIVIPVFALERAQEILYYMNKFFKEGVIPSLPVFVDSPMAINVTEVFKKYLQYFDENTRSLIEKGDSPFDFPLLKLTKTREQSTSINNMEGSAIIMAGSGMCTGGRIKHHLISNITRKESSIVFVGYQAKGTLGREIVEKEKSVRILGKQYSVKANIENIEGFSAHADKSDLFKWIDNFKEKPQKIFIIHGEEEASNEFANFLREKIKSEIIVPSYLSEFPL
ncbi:MAG: MBL fold metallo-hydrolase [Candidatus Pacebacteria bacterium]|nr:MBL fold metallo-hydrolase [Candidatus Paceibacterota bacterium]MDD4467183.1 MBL fold metallo-hydrolase [Candidatus Paceibacterota bacterium]